MKTISAYDMTVSDAIYGPADRYVSRQRLQSVLTHADNLVVERLDKPRGDKTAIFAFANTVATRSFTSTRKATAGWASVSRCAAPRPSKSSSMSACSIPGVREQEALGIVGVNLIHAAYSNLRPD